VFSVLKQREENDRGLLDITAGTISPQIT